MLLLASLLVACGDDEGNATASSSGGASGSTTGSAPTTTAQGSGGDGGATSSGSGASSGDGGQGGGSDASGGGGAGGSGAGGQDVQVTEMTVRTRVGDSASNVAFFAFQDGVGPWQPVEGLGGRYDMTRTSDRFGVAWVCEMNAYGRDFPAVAVVFATVADGFPDTLYCDAKQWEEVGGTVDGLGPNDTASVYLRGSQAGVNNSSPEVMNTEAPDMAQDVIVVRRVDGEVLDIQIERGYRPGSNFFISFDAGGIEPEEVPVGAGVFHSQLHTVGGTSAPIGRANTSLWRIPESELAVGDLQEFRSSGPDGWHSYFSRAGEAVDLPLPTASVAAQVDVAQSGPHARFSVAVDYGDALEGQVLAYHFSASQFDEVDDLFRRWAVYATEAWLDGAATFDTPGFGDLAGWNEQWSLEEGIAAETYTHAWSSSTSLGPVVRFAGSGNERYLADEDEGAHVLNIGGESDAIVP